MLRKILLASLLASILICAPAFLISQSTHAGEQDQVPYAAGLGLSSFSDSNFGSGRILGGTLWAECNPEIPILFLDGLGLEIEARDLNYARSSSQPSNFRQDTASGGAIYHWRHYSRFKPYGKFLFGFGSVDFHGGPGYNHDTRSVRTLGGGFDLRATRTIWVRADYEYQWWPHFGADPQDPSGGYSLTPQGFTLGAVYSFRALFRR